MAFLSNPRHATLRLRRNRKREEGYVLLTLLLVVALMAIAATAILPALSYRIRRDREDEMIHRGVQYSRAIRAYFKKFGRYPTKLEDLDNTNNLRYLRKHYKDPANKNQEFRLLHYGEDGVTLAGGIAGGSIPGANPIGGSAGGLNSSGGFSQPSPLGGSSSGGFGNSSFGGNQNSAFGGSTSGAFGGSAGGSNSGTNSNSNQSQNSPSSSASSQDPSTAHVTPDGATDQSSGSQPVIGGPIVGVASKSKERGFHEFNHKKKYNEWQFVYDPATDRGGLITTPNQPSLALQGFGSQQGQIQNGTQPGSPNGNSFGNSFGNSNGSSFGQSSGFGNQNSQTPPQPPPSPQQPQ